MSALLVVPAAASQHVARTFREALGGAVALALVAMVGGILLAFAFNWPPGGAIVVVSLSLFAGTVLLRRAWRWVLEAPPRRRPSS